MELMQLVLEAARAQRAFEARAARMVGLTPADSRLLQALQSGSTVSQLARRVGLTRQSVQRVADRLSERGLARFTPNPDHQRSPILRPTEAGTRARERVERELRGWEARLEEMVEAEEIESAEIVLGALRSALEA